MLLIKLDSVLRQNRICDFFFQKKKLRKGVNCHNRLEFSFCAVYFPFASTAVTHNFAFTGYLLAAVDASNNIVFVLLTHNHLYAKF